MPKPGASHSFRPVGSGATVYTNKGKSRGTPNVGSPDLPPLPYGGSQRTNYQNFDQEGLDADADVWDLRRSSPTLPSSHFGRQNVGSVHSAGARRGLQSTNEFEATNAIVYTRSKGPRVTPTTNKSPGSTLGKRRIGQDETSAIVVPDDEADVSRISTSRRLQLTAFEQGISSKSTGRAQAKNDGTKSKYFLSENPKANTSKQRHDGLRHHDGSKNLRNTFKRTPEDPIISSEDELAVSAPKKARNPKSAATYDKTDPYEKTEGLPSGGWKLEWARTHGHKETGPELSLKKGQTPAIWRVVGVNNEKRATTLFSIDLPKINVAESDGSSRIRLLGSRGANSVRQEYDLQFSYLEDLEAFMNACIKPEVKLNDKSEEYMRKVFQKSLPTGREDGHVTILSTARSESQLKPRESERPRKTGIIDTLQVSSSMNGTVTSSRGTMAQNGNVGTSTRPTRTTRANQPSYVEHKSEPVEKLGYSVRVGLGTPWKRQLTYGSGRRRAVIDFSDLTRLDDEEFLNDSLIDFYMIYLFNHSQLPADKVYFFNTHFFSTLTRKVPGHKKAINYAGVSRWTAKEDIFDYDYIVVPINQDLHWYLAIICNVRNINRKLSVDGAEKPSIPLEITSEKDHAQIVELDNTRSTSHNSSRKPSTEPEALNQAQNSDDEMLFSGDSKLDLVDPNAITESIPPVAAPRPDLLEKSIDLEVTQNNSTLPNPEPVEMAPQDTATSSFSKKPKRKPPPPVKRCDPDEPRIIILDSLGNPARSGVVRALKDYIAQEGKAKRGMDAIIEPHAFYAKGNQIPMQTNYSDCGVYVLGYIKQFFRDPDGFKNRLLTQKMNSDTDWPDMSATNMRTDIRNLLMTLHDEQDKERKRAHIANAAQKAASSPSKPSDAVIATTAVSPHATENVREGQEPSIPAIDHTDNRKNDGDAKCGTTSSPTMNGHSEAEDASQPETPIVTEAPPIVKPRLGSPFEPRPTIKSNTAAAVHTVKPIDHARRTPETVRPKKADDQPKSSERSVRKPSPRVVVTSRSPSVVPSNKRKRLDVISDMEIISPGKSQQSPSRDESTLAPLNKRIKTATSTSLRGSSVDPIPIEDSQDTIIPSPAKELPRPSVRDDSPDSVIVVPPTANNAPAVKMHKQRSAPRDRKHRSGADADKNGTTIEDIAKDRMILPL
ncbi:cysteine proteinase [Periconia macrospinosa]|uniref:Cysteine proteinase n=1 Tax=Periconia macrospinosa TaxID=97972 RepID=A0A2V1DT83_9PLEO|nr:cysteine proteinase [Periconia macrospinosa]